jgi:hypothetical protein
LHRFRWRSSSSNRLRQIRTGANANNLFGMKCSLSGNTWSGSTWTERASTQADEGAAYGRQLRDDHGGLPKVSVRGGFHRRPFRLSARREERQQATL